jgi:membrane-associated phospholipid phosphatase
MSTDEAVVRPVREVRAPAPGRMLAAALPVLWALALSVSVLRWGLPVARDQLFFWLGLGLLSFSVAAWRSWGSMLLEWLPFFALLVAYDRLRGAVSVPPEQANVDPQVAFDRALGLGEIPTVWLQQRLWDAAHLHWYDLAAFAVYLTHFFAVWVVAAVIWRVARPRFRRYVALVLLVTLGAFLTYWLFPAQPPWMAEDEPGMAQVTRIVPQVWDTLGISTMRSVYEDESLVNLVAAMPSLHAAYPMMLLLFFWPAGWWARAGLGAYTVAMGWVLVYGGEHFVLDILAGWLLALGAWALLAVLWPRLPARLTGSASPTPGAPSPAVQPGR